MKSFRTLRLALLPVLVFGFLGAPGCDDNNDISGSGGALATLLVDAPDSAVSGQPFESRSRANAIGIENVHNGRVQVTLPAPSRDGRAASPGTSATFANTGVGGAR